MKILHVTKKYPNALGGDAVVVSNLEKQQRKNGHRVVILTSNCDEIKNGKDIYKFGLKDTPASLDSITVRRLLSLIMLYFRAYKVLGAEKPDVIHTHSIDMAFFISFAARRYRIPIVHTFHIVTFNDPRQKGIRSKVELFFLRGAKPRKIFVLNPADIKDFEAADFTNAVFVPNGVNVGDWQTKGRKNRNDVFTFIAVGRLEEQKGFTYLIDAAVELRKTHKAFLIQIVGEGSLKDNLQKQIDELGLRDTVLLLGRKNPLQLKELYAAADVFVLSSLWEGMPLSLLEAWAAGLPTIATNVSSVPYIAEHTSSFVEAQNSMGLATAMGELMSSKKQMEVLQKASVANVKNYDWEKISRIILDWYIDSRRKKIVQVTAYFYPHLGGVEKSIESIANNLHSKNWDVSVLASNAGYFKNDKHFPYDVDYIKSLDIAHTPVMPSLFVKLWQVSKNSIIHIHAAQMLTPEIAFLIAKLRKAPIIISPHTDVQASGGAGFLLPLYKKTSFGFLVRHCDRLVVLNNSYKEFFMEKYKVNPDNIVVVPNGVDEQFFINKSHAVKESRFRLLFVGRLTAEKNVPTIIEAVSTTGFPVQLDVVGDGPLRREWEELAGSVKRQKIIFHGQKSANELVEFYREADVLILVSDYEGQPTVIMEAMASGTPVIGADVIGIRDTVGQDGMLIEKSSEALSNAIAKLANDIRLQEALSKKARQRAETFHWDKSIKKLEKVYAGL